MSISEIRTSALGLPDSDRAALAADLLESLPAVLFDDDEGVAEAMRRSRELDENPAMACSWEEIKRSLGR